MKAPQFEFAERKRTPLADLLRRLFFVPRVSAGESEMLKRIVELTQRRFEIVRVLGSSTLSPDPKLLSYARECGDYVWVDPDVERMGHPVLGRRKGLTKLLDEFRAGTAVGTLDLDWLQKNREAFVRRVITFQRECQADAVQAPNLMFYSPRDEWYSESLEMARATASIVEAPIIVKVTAGAEFLGQPSYRDRLAADYRDLDVAFFYLQIEHHDELTTIEYDAAYVDLVSKLAVRAPVLPGSVGFFGLICAGFGTSGFGASIQGVEAFEREVLRQGGGARKSSKYHVDDTMMVMK